MTSRTNIIVIGAGIAGVSASYYLNKAGLDVTILDFDGASNNCSYGNAGLIVPSHFIPLASPGAVSKGLRWMLKADSPFYIKPRPDRDLINWGLKFIQASNRKHVDEAAPILKDLMMKNRGLLIDLEQKEGLEFGLQKKGLLMLCNTEKGMAEEEKTVLKACQLDLPAKMLSVDEVKKMEPNIHMNIIGGAYYPEDAHFNPGRLMDGLKALLKERGVRFRYNTRVAGIELNGDVITGVKTADGIVYGCSGLVVCTGVWTSSLKRTLGICLPMQAGKGYSITLQNPEVIPQHCSMFSEAYVAVTPMNGMLRFAGTMEISGIDTGINQKKVIALKKSVSAYLPDYTVEALDKQDVWVGLRPCSPDGLPYVGNLSQYRNAWVSAGHGFLGMSLGLVSGKLITNQILSSENEPDLHLLHPGRYN